MPAIVLIICLFGLTGCFNVKEYNYVVKQNSRLSNDNNQLAKRVAQLEMENQDLKGQLQSLSGINDKHRYENLTLAQSIEIYRLSGIYSKPNDGHNELSVYIIPRDGKGDPIKAAGSLTIELWNLAAKGGDTMLARWEVGADELSRNWGISMLTGYYRLRFELPMKLDDRGDYMVKAAFTDFVTGKVLTAHAEALIKNKN